VLVTKVALISSVPKSVHWLSCIAGLSGSLCLGCGRRVGGVERVGGRGPAGVGPRYVVFRSKRGVLKALMEKRVSRDGPGPPCPAAGEGAPDARTVLRRLAAGGTRLFERAAPIWAITREAAAADPVIAKWWEAEMDRRHANFRRYVQMLPERSLKAGLAEDAAVDIFWTVASPETFEALVGRRGWTPEEFETWIAEATADLLLG
jgi:hypothetical protein